ncbi:hypothetical protein WA158_002027 [Blastocystis sp. Blastoise]
MVSSLLFDNIKLCFDKKLSAEDCDLFVGFNKEPKSPVLSSDNGYICKSFLIPIGEIKISLYDPDDIRRSKQLCNITCFVSLVDKTSNIPNKTGNKESDIYSNIQKKYIAEPFTPTLTDSLEESVLVKDKMMSDEYYTGYLCHSKKVGRARSVYVSGPKKGELYIGDYKDDKKNGKGKYIYSDGDYYDGDWIDDLENGRGRYVYNDGDEYDGDWKEGNMDGYGIYKSEDGIYEGEWKEDEMNGKGIFKYKNGEVYSGYYKQGKKEGKGKYVYNNKDCYEGYFKDDNYNGLGIYTYGKGDMYRGEWKNDVKCGKGTYYSIDGVTESGRWENDELVEQDEEVIEYFIDEDIEEEIK